MHTTRPASQRDCCALGFARYRASPWWANPFVSSRRAVTRAGLSELSAASTAAKTEPKVAQMTAPTRPSNTSAPGSFKLCFLADSSVGAPVDRSTYRLQNLADVWRGAQGWGPAAGGDKWTKIERNFATFGEFGPTGGYGQRSCDPTLRQPGGRPTPSASRAAPSERRSGLPQPFKARPRPSSGHGQAPIDGRPTWAIVGRASGTRGRGGAGGRLQGETARARARHTARQPAPRRPGP